MPRFRAPAVKPAYGVRADPAHPLGRALTHAWVFNNGISTPDLVTGLGVDTSAGWNVWSPSDGGALESTGTSGAYSTGVTETWTPSGTVVWRMFPAFAYNAGTIRWMWGLQQGGGSSEFSAQIFSDNTWYVGWTTAGADRRVIVPASAANLVQDAWQTYALTWGPAGSVFYRNGQVLGTNASALGVPNVSGYSFFINTTNQANTLANQTHGLPSGSRTALTYLFNRTLTPGEVAALYADPYTLLAPKRRAFRVVVGTGDQTLVPTGVASPAAFGTALVAPDLAVLPGGVASPALYGTPDVMQEVQPAGVASPALYGTPSVLLEIQPTGVASPAAYGTPVVVGETTLSPAGVDSPALYGNLLVSLELTMAGVSSPAAYGTPVVTVGAAPAIVPSGVDSPAVVGQPLVEGGDVTVPTGSRSRSNIRI